MRKARGLFITLVLVIVILSTFIAEWVVGVILPGPLDGAGVHVTGEPPNLPVARSCACSQQAPPPLGAPLPPWRP